MGATFLPLACWYCMPPVAENTRCICPDEEAAGVVLVFFFLVVGIHDRGTGKKGVFVTCKPRMHEHRRCCKHTRP